MAPDLGPEADGNSGAGTNAVEGSRHVIEGGSDGYVFTKTGRDFFEVGTITQRSEVGAVVLRGSESQYAS